MVQLSGEVGNVNDALIQIVLRLRDDVLRDRDGVGNPTAATESLYSGGASLSVPSVLPSVSQVASLGYDQRTESGSGLGMISSSSLYGYGSLSVCRYLDKLCSFFEVITKSLLSFCCNLE